MQPGSCQPVRQEFMENECEALPGVAYPGVRDNRSTLNTKTGYDDVVTWVRLGGKCIYSIQFQPLCHLPTKTLKFMDIYRSSDRNKNAQFFETWCIIIKNKQKSIEISLTNTSLIIKSTGDTKNSSS